jgi:hypothetical protein
MPRQGVSPARVQRYASNWVMPRSKRAALIGGGIIFGALAYFVYLIGIGFDLWQPLTRPAGVSSRARYTSDLTRGWWIDCSVDDSHDVDVCKAWDDNGKLVAFGNYRLDEKNRAATEEELRPSVVHPGPPDRPALAWIYLYKGHETRGRLLVPVNAAGQPLERFEVTFGSDSQCPDTSRIPASGGPPGKASVARRVHRH